MGRQVKLLSRHVETGVMVVVNNIAQSFCPTFVKFCKRYILPSYDTRLSLSTLYSILLRPSISSHPSQIYEINPLHLESIATFLHIQIYSSQIFIGDHVLKFY